MMDKNKFAWPHGAGRSGEELVSYFCSLFEESPDLDFSKVETSQAESGFQLGTQRIIPFLPLALSCDHEVFFKEISRLGDYFLPHRTTGRPGGHVGWKQTCIRGLLWDMTAENAYYGLEYEDESKVPYRWTEVADRCPATVAWIKNNLPFQEFYRIRVMALEPGGYILPHRDRIDAGLKTALISVNAPVGSEFYLEGAGRLPLASGLVYAIDNSRFHCLRNTSNETRFQIQILAKPSTDWFDMLFASYQLELARMETKKRPGKKALMDEC